jgi:hypothetical protein
VDLLKFHCTYIKIFAPHLNHTSFGPLNDVKHRQNDHAHVRLNEYATISMVNLCVSQKHLVPYSQHLIFFVTNE